MTILRPSLLAALAAVATWSTPVRGDDGSKDRPIKVLTWNIWNGGDEARHETSPEKKLAKQKRVAETIRASGADIVAMVETYGSGEVIAKELGFHFHPRGTNVSILSRWPIQEDLSVYKPFHCVGVLIEPPGGPPMAVYSVWIHYVDDIWTDPHSRDGRSAEDLLADDGPSRVVEVREILDGVSEKTANLKGAAVIVAGDFNSNSHLDYTEAAKDQYGLVVEWLVTKTMTDAGFHDAYRDLNPTIDRHKDRTWSPRFPDQIQDRIDFVFWKGPTLTPLAARMLDQPPDPGLWPSDHAAVLVEFERP